MFDLMELEAFWLKRPVNGQIRYQEGDLVAMYDGCIVAGFHATHKIIGCYGDVFSTIIVILVIDVLTNEPNFIRIK